MSIFQHTESVCLELSNLCNYANFHKKCPVNLMQKDHIILPIKLVHDVLYTLNKHRYSGSISFHTYNEPLMDPRLFEFIRLARAIVPDSNILIWTNGYYINENFVNELVDAGMTTLYTTAYNEEEKQRLEAIQVPIPYKVWFIPPCHQDDILTRYEDLPTGCTESCHAPLRQIIVSAKGEITLCCHEWKRQHTFGSLEDLPFEDIMKNPDLQIVYNELIQGIRTLDYCKRCPTSR